MFMFDELMVDCLINNQSLNDQFCYIFQPGFNPTKTVC